MNSNDSLFNDNNVSRSYKKKSPYFFNDPKLYKLVEENNVKINLSRIKDLSNLNSNQPDIQELQRKYLNYNMISDNHFINSDYIEDDYY